MFKLLILYAHLLATCTALGVIIATDLRLLGKLTSPDLRIAPPNRYVEQLVAAALAVLYATGAVLILLGLQERGDYLLNPKLIAKLAFVALLTANAYVLHRHTFRRLTRPRPVSSWSLKDRLSIAIPVAMSNGLWMFCAFLGIARPWNFTMSLSTVLGIGAMVVLMAVLGVLAMLSFAARRGVAVAEPEYEETEFVPRASMSAFAANAAKDTTIEMVWNGMPGPMGVAR
ncbi:hypothetical protein BH09PSE5_BH09PSE5_02490 [soil metagenome]